MGIKAIYAKPKTSQPNPENTVYPYRLRDKTIEKPMQVWATDITYVPMRRGFMYLVAIVDWYGQSCLGVFPIRWTLIFALKHLRKP